MGINSEVGEEMSSQWDIGLTRSLVTAIFGSAQWKKAHPSVRSMTDRSEFCRYHYHETLGMMNNYIESNLKERGLFGVYDDYDEFSYLMLKIRANIVAFVQSMHAVADTCSHMIYYSLGLDMLSKPLKERNINASGVLSRLQQQRDAGHCEYDKLCSLLREVSTGSDYKYLNALTNTSKHRSIVRPQLNEDVTGTREEKWILFLDSFFYDGEFFGKINVRGFMRSEYDRIQPLIVNIGVELNELLKMLQALKSTDQNLEKSS